MTGPDQRRALEPGAADDRAAWFLDPATGDRSQVPFPETVGPLAGGTRRAENPTANRPWPVTTGSLIALRGHLYGNDTLIWPHRDGLIWPRPRHSGAVMTV